MSDRRFIARGILRHGILLLLLAGGLPASGATSAPASPPPAAPPRLFHTSLRLEPTLRQVDTLPAISPEWKLAPGVITQWDDIMAASGFPAPLRAELQRLLVISPGNREGTLTPTPALLDLFRPTDRARWWVVLSGHFANRAYRWPIAIRETELDLMATTSAFAEAVQRVRRWGVPSGERILFADLFALRDAFPDEVSRRLFFQQLLSAETSFLKWVADTPDPAALAAQAAYWQTPTHRGELEPILSAISNISGHDRIDLAHLLPRLARALLYTYPPDFAAASEPPQENAAMAVGYFAPDLDPQSVLAPGFSAWLEAHCDPVSGDDRHYGDIIVFEDTTRTRWPFNMVYLADGIVFGRRPSLYGPWELLPETLIPEINPHLRGRPVTVWRRRPTNPAPLSSDAPVPESSLPPPPPLELRELAAGPWGKLWSYDVLLAPSRAMLDLLPAPAAQPQWTFYQTSVRDIEKTLATLAMPETTRQPLRALFAGARPDARGLLTVHPTPELVLATPAAFRTQHFPRLRHGAAADDYAQDVFIPSRLGAEAWFTPDLLPASARDPLLRLVYPRGDGLMLSDYGALYHAVSDPAIRRQTLRTLFRTPARLVLLERPAPEEVPGLVDYWNLDQQKSIGRLLESFAANDDMAYLDIVHLLPPLAREMMNVYLRTAADDPAPSCYWTALNFAAEQPDSRLLVIPRKPGQESAVAWSKLRRDYRPIPAASRLGDVIAYRRKSDDELSHVCVFVAAEVVFTKNGFGPHAPWCLMTLADVDALYLEPGRIERLAFRPKSVH